MSSNPDWLVKLTLFLHAGTSVILLGAAGHYALMTLGSLRGRPAPPRLAGVYTRSILVAYLLCFVTGAMTYPAFKRDVRPELDRAIPWATGLFEIKEHFAAIGLLACLALWLVSRNGGSSRWVNALVVLIASLIFYLGGAGTLLVMLRSV
ncbi:MAG: hypothetical protein HY791_28225 [Deltaproteobacteria bacterium]|nr:hypothetical protein [Deltaproteobacteria bacterium]